MDEIDKSVVLSTLCQHFKLDFDELDPVVSEQLLYIYRKVSEWTAQTELGKVMGELEVYEQRFKQRGRLKRIYKLYEWCKHTNMINSQRYNTKTTKPPLMPIDKLTLLTRKANYR